MKGEAKAFGHLSHGLDESPRPRQPSVWRAQHDEPQPEPSQHLVEKRGWQAYVRPDSRLDRVERQSTERLHLLHKMDQAILEAQSLPAIAHVSLSHIRELIPCQRMSIALVDFEAQRMQVLAVHADGGPHLQVGTELPLPSPAYIQQFQRGGRVVQDALSLTNPSQLDAQLRAAGLRSWVNISLIAGGKLVGLLNLGAVRPYFFTSEYLDIGHEVARPLAIALQQARLQGEIQDQTRQLAKANHDLRTEVAERKRAEQALRMAHAELEQRVQERTAALADANEALHAEIGERKQAQAQIQASLQEKEVLLREIHHRVKNNLQVISSLLRLQAEAVPEPITQALFQEGQDRVRSMALVHEQLYQSADLAQIDFGEYIRHLVAHLRLSYTRSSQPVALQVEADAVRLGVNVAVPCGLILNELVTNALKHAFPDDRTGEIRVRLQIDRQLPSARPVGILEIQDNGIGLPKGMDIAQTESLGLYLVHRLTRQLEGQLEVGNHHGTRFQLRFPLSQAGNG